MSVWPERTLSAANEPADDGCNGDKLGGAASTWPRSASALEMDKFLVTMVSSPSNPWRIRSLNHGGTTGPWTSSDKEVADLVAAN